MAVFKNLSNECVSETENKIASRWEEMDILDRTIKNRDDAENFVFYEGPPTANGKPGIHHVIARTLKDSVCKYQTMKGYRVLRKAGWDTHGLPVEIEVEKQLGISSKPEIEAYASPSSIRNVRILSSAMKTMARNEQAHGLFHRPGKSLHHPG